MLRAKRTMLRQHYNALRKTQKIMPPLAQCQSQPDMHAYYRADKMIAALPPTGIAVAGTAAARA